MCLATLATSVCCCAGALCCECLCIPVKAFGVAAKNFSKVGYVFFQLFWILLAIGTMYAGTWFVDWTSWVGIQCPENSGNGDACFSASGLVRISFCLAIF